MIIYEKSRKLHVQIQINWKRKIIKWVRTCIQHFNINIMKHQESFL